MRTHLIVVDYIHNSCQLMFIFALGDENDASDLNILAKEHGEQRLKRHN